MNDQIKSVATLAFMITLWAAPQLKAAEPTLKEVLTALRNADAAGDTQAAHRLAQIARPMQLSSSTTKITVIENGVGGKQGASAQSKVKPNLVLYEVTLPDGTVYQIEGPKGALRADVIAAVNRRAKEKEEEDRLNRLLKYSPMPCLEKYSTA